MSAELEAIQDACRELQRNRPKRALEALRPIRGSGSALSESLALASQGLLHERAGMAEDAARCFEQVLAQGAPLPALLRTCGAYFERTGDFDKAFHCYALLRDSSPRALTEFRRGLPQPELARYAPAFFRQMLTGQRPAFYELVSVKRALVSRLGAEAAGLAYGQMARWRDPSVETMPIASLREFAKTHAVLYEEGCPGREVDVPPLPVFGRPHPVGERANTRTLFFSILADARVSSNSNFALAGGRALLEYQDAELREAPVNLNVDPTVIAADEASVTTVTARPSRVLEEALSLVGIHSGNFGHWLIEFLPRVFGSLDRPGFDSLPILVDARMPPQHLEALRLFAGPKHRIVDLAPGKTVDVKRLWMCSAPTYLAVGLKPGEPDRRRYQHVMDGAALTGLLGSVEPILERIDTEGSPRRVYLTRLDTEHRRIVNRTEVEGWFAANGFEVVYPGNLPFAEQLRLVRGAEVVVGAGGSSLLLTQFAGPGTRLGVLDNHYLEDKRWFAFACRALGQHLLILPGEVDSEHKRYPMFSDYRIDTAALPAFLEQLLSKG